jgi:hypothetical protein
MMAQMHLIHSKADIYTSRLKVAVNVWLLVREMGRKKGSS